eukprot:CAMPEP_0180220164 /NCGR_PEP_ID=MMETSP0987-20121128/18957_1 /TAXON_ID=697907 /ORGANISM="non described non described, Strain CCMP2293" /LENGTH=89 /DNA_ID=CAMNT_0022181019 /DNA_START=70 /DNA_END=339 /DNA_ORIENTATION=-
MGMGTGAATTRGSDRSSRASAMLPASPRFASSESSICGHAALPFLIAGNDVPFFPPLKSRRAALSNCESVALTPLASRAGSSASNPSRG